MHHSPTRSWQVCIQMHCEGFGLVVLHAHIHHCETVMFLHVKYKSLKWKQGIIPEQSGKNNLRKASAVYDIKSS